MKDFLKILILPITIITMLGSFAPRAFAVSPMTVVFESNPLFGVVNFLPGDSKDGDAIVTNNTDTPQSVYAESVNGFDPDGLGSQLYLKVFENGNIVPVYQNEFDDFLSAVPVPLSSLGALATKTYTFEVSFIDSADNDYMGKSLGFDLCIGFSSGTFQCGNTVVSDPEDPVTPSDPPGGGGGGGGGGQPTQLIVYNEFVSDMTEGVPPPILNDGTATIQWDTNLLATSQVIYGPSGVSYPFNVNTLPYMGYPSGTIENGTKVLHHTVVLTGLVDGVTYVYRVVSRASPPTVSIEHTFTMPTSGNVVLAQSGPTDGEISRATLDTNTNSTSTQEEDNSDLLAFTLGGLNFSLAGLLCIGLALIIFIVLLWLTRLVSRPARPNGHSGGNKKDKSLSRDVALLVTFGLIVSVILWLVPYSCPIIPLWVIIAIYVIWKLITRREERF